MIYQFTKIAYKRWTDQEVKILKDLFIAGRSQDIPHSEIWDLISKQLDRPVSEIKKKIVRLYKNDSELEKYKQNSWTRENILEQLKDLYTNNRPINKNHLPDHLKFILLKVTNDKTPEHRRFFSSIDHALAEAIYSHGYYRDEDGSFKQRIDSLQDALKYVRLQHKKRHEWTLDEVKEILTILNEADYPITLPFLTHHYPIYKDTVGINRKLESFKDVIKKFINDQSIKSYPDLVCTIAPDYIAYYDEGLTRLRLSTEEIRVKKFLDRYKISYIIPKLSDKLPTGLENFGNFVPDFVILGEDKKPIGIIEVFGSIGDRENAGVNNIYDQKTQAKIEFYKKIPGIDFIEVYNYGGKCDLDDDSLFGKLGKYIIMNKQAQTANENDITARIYTKENGKQDFYNMEDLYKFSNQYDLFYTNSPKLILHREDGPAVEYFKGHSKGFKQWYINGKKNREDGPAIEFPNGDKFWYTNGELHREDGPAREYATGNKHWYTNGELHREDGPAIEVTDGTKYWYRNNELHREDGPAMEDANGDKRWYINDKLHREDGPAIEHADGHKEWYMSGKLHREDGPAMEYPNGSKQWYRNGECHREDGPAIEFADGAKGWYMHDRFLQDPKIHGDLKQQYYDLYIKPFEEVSIHTKDISISGKFPFDIKVDFKPLDDNYKQIVILLVPNDQTKKLLGDELYKLYSGIPTHRYQNEICHARVDIDKDTKTWYIVELQSDKLTRASKELDKKSSNRINKIFHDWKYELIDVIKQTAKKQDPENKVRLATSGSVLPISGVSKQKAEETYDKPGEKLKLERIKEKNPYYSQQLQDKETNELENEQEYWKVASIKSFTKIAEDFTMPFFRRNYDYSQESIYHGNMDRYKSVEEFLKQRKKKKKYKAKDVRVKSPKTTSNIKSFTKISSMGNDYTTETVDYEKILKDNNVNNKGLNNMTNDYDDDFKKEEQKLFQKLRSHPILKDIYAQIDKTKNETFEYDFQEAVVKSCKYQTKIDAIHLLKNGQINIVEPIRLIAIQLTNILDRLNTYNKNAETDEQKYLNDIIMIENIQQVGIANFDMIYEYCLNFRNKANNIIATKAKNKRLSLDELIRVSESDTILYKKLADQELEQRILKINNKNELATLLVCNSQEIRDLAKDRYKQLESTKQSSIKQFTKVADINSLKDLIKIQTSDGNWNYDPYMQGLANGMILSEHIVEDKEGTPEFLDAPKKWLKDANIKTAKVVSFGENDVIDISQHQLIRAKERGFNYNLEEIFQKNPSLVEYIKSKSSPGKFLNIELPNKFKVIIGLEPMIRVDKNDKSYKMWFIKTILSPEMRPFNRDEKLSIEKLVANTEQKLQENIEKFGCGILYNPIEKYSFVTKAGLNFKFDSLFELPELTPKHPALKKIIDRILKENNMLDDYQQDTESQTDYQPPKKDPYGQSNRQVSFTTTDYQ